MAKGKKTFGDKVNVAFEEAAQEPANLGELESLFAEIPEAGSSGNDMIEEFLSTVNDLTVKESPLAEWVAPEAKETKKTASPDQLGDPSGISSDFVEIVQKARKGGKTFEEAEAIAKNQTSAPPPQAVTGEYYGTDPQAAPGNVTVTQPPPPAPPRDLTPQDLQGNAIAAEEIIEWYDVLQSVGSVWAYDAFAQPKNAVKLVEQLTEKVLQNKATASEKEAFAAAQKTVNGYAGRKATFAENVAMSENLKTRSIRILDKILEVRGIVIPPEALLALLLITPLVLNTGKILVERFGFSDADKVLDKFTTFVSKAETKYHEETP